VSARPVEIAPSILSADFLRLGLQVSDALEAGVRRIHVDVMDGHFVPNLRCRTRSRQGVRRIHVDVMDGHFVPNLSMVCRSIRDSAGRRSSPGRSTK